MRQSYLKNAALMTGADVLLRLAGMGLRIWLANALGGEGMGLYQLVLAVYSLFVTLATARRWACRGWRCRRYCGAFSSPGGRWSQTS